MFFLNGYKEYITYSGGCISVASLLSTTYNK
jgi:hypothetical protein